MSGPGENALASAVEQWRITSIGSIDTSIIVVLLVIAVGLSIWTWFSLDPVKPLKWRASIIVLRFSALVIAITILAQLSIHKEKLKKAPKQLAVLVDVSQSMKIGGTSSLDKARAMLKTTKNALEKINNKEKIAWYRFAGELSIAANMEDAFTGKTDEGFRTNISSAISKLAETNNSTPLSGIVLISDGADTEISSSYLDTDDLPWAKLPGVPVNTVSIGGIENLVDLAIKSTKVEPFAFLRSETPIEVSIKSFGMPDSDVEVFLWQDDALVQRRKIRLVGGEGRIAFNVFPSNLGPQIYKVTVPIPDNDQIPLNNTAYAFIDVARDKYRILHISGAPSWDQLFLRRALKAWPKVDLVSFYILRTPEQSRNLGADGMALIPFPTEDVFKTHLNEFDIVIFQAFEPASVGVDSYLDQIASFVRHGGAFAMIGGSEGMTGDSVASSELKTILPVVFFDQNTAVSRRIDKVPFRPWLTESGLRHPVMQIASQETDKTHLLSALDKLDGIDMVASLASGAYCLAEHPFVKSDDGPAPVIAVKETENGRALVIATDSLWRWRFTGPMKGGPPDVFSNFWHQAIEWLAKSPNLNRMKIKVTPSFGGVESEPISIDIELLDESYKPVPRAELKGVIIWSGEYSKEKKTSDFNAVLDDNGRYHMEWVPTSAGPHIIRVKGLNDIKSETRFLVDSKNKELANLDPRPDLLERISKVTGGIFQSNSMDPAHWKTSETVRGETVLSQTDIGLWDNLIVIVLFLGMICSEWLIRRKIGLK